ncbi:cation-translocating P-type ATPase [Chitinophaga japonensis]|nr:cation-translocating P-type ATPase [Chitinophaga japonensis]
MIRNISTPVQYSGLRQADVPRLQALHGKNKFQAASSGKWRSMVWGIVREPMFLLLLAACLVYFILGSFAEGSMILLAMLLVTAISLYQEVKSSRALEALRQYTAPRATVIRDGREKMVDTEELVPGDLLLLSEGELAPADGIIISANDLTVNESLMTGESLPVEKGPVPGNNLLYQGTTINTGRCMVKVAATGNQTALAQMGQAIATVETPPTLLQRQVNRAVRRLALFGIVAFIAICVVSFIKGNGLAASILLGLTLAMAAIPEEIPVAFSSFMALGAYYMSGKGIISRQPQVIEHLGAIGVLCLDKTGTITENRMKVVMVYDHRTGRQTDMTQQSLPGDSRLLFYAALASERQPFDTMEKAIFEAYTEQEPLHAPLPFMLHEYPLEGRPPMMTHVYPHNGSLIAAAKGAPERIMQVCRLEEAAVQELNGLLKTMASRGYRVLGVATALHAGGELPAAQDSFNWQFEGFICLYDPPKENAAAVIEQVYDAGIRVKLITGDYPETARYIAQQTGIRNHLYSITGEEVMAMSDTQLQSTVNLVSVYTRMFPEAKLKVINALKAGGEIVAMTGDGVNDGPALKAADIGIAMGKKGTEIARLAADLVITDDDLEKIPEAVYQGRKVYSNLKKAVRYIISIHIPIILTAALPLLLGWKYPVIFTPIHVIFLELIMGPTCSIFFEREPVEAADMSAAGNRRNESLFRTDELLITITQGLIITAGVLGIYYYFMQAFSLEMTRTMVFTTLLISNIFLTFTNRSFTENVAHTMRYKNSLAPLVLIVSLLFLVLIHLVAPVRQLFGLTAISFAAFMICLATAFISIAWFELYKTNLKSDRIRA